jgi:8-oxo-dGTP diphosphatase
MVLGYGGKSSSGIGLLEMQGVPTMEEKTLLKAVVIFPALENDILLAIKTGKIGAGCWNGYGGGIEPGESPPEAAVRELFEESGLIATVEGLQKIAIVDFHNQKSDGSMFVCSVHMYLAKEWTGEVHETPEMRNPTWFARDALPLEGMMPADRDWVPPTLEGKLIRAKAWYGPFQKALLRPTEITIVDHLDD